MIVDCHTHLSTREQWGRQFVEAVERAYSGTPIDLNSTPERHWEASEEADRVIVFGINSDFLGMNTPNDQIAAYARQHPEKIIGFMSIDPHAPDALDELERAVNELGLKGIKTSPVYQNYHPDDPKLHEIYQRAVKYNLPILTHAAYHCIPPTPMKYANPLLYDDVAIQFPELKIILAHMGLPWAEDAMVMARKHPNVYADISALPVRSWWSYHALLTFFESGCFHKLLFGSDFPFWTVGETSQSLRNLNRIVRNSGFTQIPEELIEGLIHRDTLSLLEIAE